MTPRRDPKVVGIAPGALSEFIADLQSKVDDGRPLLGSLRSAFLKHGISAENIVQIERIFRWIDDQIPMLQRRQSLAEEAGAEKFDLQASVPMVTAGAGPLGSFKSVGDAKAVGRRDAQEVLRILQNDGSLSDIMRKLAANAADPDYTEAFYRELGPLGVQSLNAAISRMRHGGHPGEAKDAQTVIGKSLATASHRIQIDRHWLDQLASSPAIASSEGPAVLSSFLKYGNFDREWLKLLGAHAISGVVRSDSEQEIWQALAKNSRAATEFYYDHFPEIQQYVTRAGLSGIRTVQVSFANVIRAATVVGRNVDRWRAEFNASATINYWKKYPIEHTLDAIRDAYSDLVVEYWPDLVYTVTSPVAEAGAIDNPFRQGIEVPEDSWSALIKEAMRNPNAAAKILAKHRLWLDESRHKSISGTPHGDEPSNWYGPSIGAMRVFLESAYSDVSKEIAKQGAAAKDKWNANINSSIEDATRWLVDKGIEKLDPEANIKWAASTVSLVANRGLDYLFGDDGSGRPIEVQRKTQFTGRNSWQSNAITLWEQRVREGYRSLDRVWFSGKPWTGDVRIYERRFGAKFSDERGYILPFQQISNDPRALLAYNEWLKDPAVIKATEKFVRAEQGLPGGN